MGRTNTPKYVLDMTGFINHGRTPTVWKGRIPTVAQLERVVMAECVSTMPGFVNQHIGNAFGIQFASYACVRENKRDGKVLVEWKATMFQVFPEPKDYPEVAKVTG